MHTYLVLGRMSRLFSLKIQRYSANELIKTYIKKTLGCFSVSFLVCTIFHFVSNQNVTDCTHKDSKFTHRHLPKCIQLNCSQQHFFLSSLLHFCWCFGAQKTKQFKDQFCVICLAFWKLCGYVVLACALCFSFSAFFVYGFAFRLFAICKIYLGYLSELQLF